MHGEYRGGTLVFLLGECAACVSDKQTVGMVKKQEKKRRTNCHMVQGRPSVERTALGLKRPDALLGGGGQGLGMEPMFISW